MASQPASITFIVPGTSADSTPGATRSGGDFAPGTTPLGMPGELKQSVRLGAVRAGVPAQRLQARPGQDVVVLHLAGGPSLVLHPETARDLLLAQQGVPRPSGAAPASVNVAPQLQWPGPPAPGATRGLLGNVLLAGLDIVAEPLKDKAEDFVAAQLVQRLDAQVDEGLYALQPDALRALKGQAKVQIPASAAGQPCLVFVHGTFSTTLSGFGKLWSQHPQRVRALFSHYQDRVFALDHATLGASPLDNALTLARACAKGSRLHLVTHSRGGLVAEVLARAAALKQASDEDLSFFSGQPKTQAVLKELVQLLRQRDIQIDRVVRVACPARGTLLASQRLDAWLSGLKWALDLAQVPVAPMLVDLLAGVAQRRTQPDEIPGIAAMVPDSPLIRWLHAVDEPVPGQLFALAGDLQGDSIGSWFKTLLSDSFFRTDHDLVVNTSSMYGGAPRQGGASFVLDAGGRVNHFNYFSNERSAEAVVAALTQPHPAGWQPIGPLSWAGESSTGTRGSLRAARGADGPPAAERPAVFVLPGILGSHIAVGGKRIWLGWRLVGGLKRLVYPEPAGTEVRADGAIGMIYEDLMDHLAASHEVIEFSFDWRRPLEQEAARLGKAVEQAMAARESSGQPVRLLAHSMGGVLARTMALECPAIWKRLMAHPGARLLMLGTPNGGSWAPMQCLSGDDNFGNMLTAFGAPFQDREARAMMARFPGFLQLQAGLLDEATGLGRSERWRELAEDDIRRVREHNWWHADARQLNAYEWGIPPQPVLDQAKALRLRLDKQRDEVLPQWADKLALVVGHAKFTPDGYELGDEGLAYLDTPESGDGRVPLWSALLPGVRTWKLDCDHGALPDEEDAFDAYLEILQTGRTQRLAALPTPGVQRGGAAALAQRSGGTPVRSRPGRQRRASALPPDRDPLREQAVTAEQAPGQRALPVSVHNGDLKFTRDTLLVGHYSTNNLTGTEAVVNRLVGGTLADSLAMGQYPDAPGTHQIFINRSANTDNPLQMPRPEGVVVVGLGPEGRMKPPDLVSSVKLAVLAQAQRLVEQPEGTAAVFDLASTLIASGGVGVSPGQAAQLVAQGVAAADQALADVNQSLAQRATEGRPLRSWPRVGRLHFIELYLDRASEAWRALRAMQESQPGRWQVADTVECDPGALRRPLDGGYRGADYDLITAVAAGNAGDERIAYTVDTKRARSEVRAASTQIKLVRELVASASRHDASDSSIGRTLFQLLVPVEMQPHLGGGSELLLRLNSGSAGIPWELLDTDAGQVGSGGDHKPWALRTKLLRTLMQQDFRRQVVDASADAHVLVVGEPQAWHLGEDGKRVDYLPLPGARAEAKAVADCLSADGALPPERVRAVVALEAGLPGPGAQDVIGALLERPWRIVHIAGHGEAALPAQDGRPADPRGVVLSNGTFLGPREIEAMRVVPELVFVNCCHLARRNPDDLLAQEGTRDHAAFAGSVAEALIGLGVRCVVAAGWAVDDAAAETFATRLYAALLRGARFIDAVGAARTAAHAHGGNTWAAYQCYGDPEWTLRRATGDAQGPAIRPLAEEFAGVASPPALTLALESLVVGARFQGRDKAEQLERVRHLQARFGPQWGDIGAVAEAFGLAFDATGDRGMAQHWYERALGCNDGSASLQAGQQLANLQVREAWGLVRTKGPRAVAAARRSIAAAQKRLDTLLALHPTLERHMLCASAHKRLSMVARIAKDAAGERRALQAMLKACERAIACAGDDMRELHYPLSNRLSAQLALGEGTDPADFARLGQLLQQRVRADPDFWSVVGLTELHLMQALATATLATALPSLCAELTDLQARVSAPGWWDSVADQTHWLLGHHSGAAADKLRRQLAGYAGWSKP